VTVWITLSSGLMYRVNGRGRPRKPDGLLSPTSKKADRSARLEAACQAKYGVSRAEWKALSLAGVIGSYRHQRASAKSRGRSARP
jgi:hypothetical protein